MVYQLRERAPQSLAEMQDAAVSVEANLIAKRNRTRSERKTTFKEEPSSHDQKLDAIISSMNRMGDRLDNVERNTSWENQQPNTARNPNFRKTQNMNMGRANQDHNIRPPFQENFAEASTYVDPTDGTLMNLVDSENGQQSSFTEENPPYLNIEQFRTKSRESFDFKQGYDTAIYEVHKKYKLRTRTVDVSPPSRAKEGKQPNKAKGKSTNGHTIDNQVPNSQQVIVEM